MTRQEANEAAKKLAEWEMKERDKITEEAKKAGIWVDGLDTNRELFRELDELVKKRLKEINSQVEV